MTSIGPVPMEVDLDDFAEAFQDHGMYPHQVAEFVTELVSNAKEADAVMGALIRAYFQERFANAQKEVSDTLASCPHCGQDKAEIVEDHESTDFVQYQVRCCFNRGGCGSGSGVRTSLGEVIALWNRRV